MERDAILKAFEWNSAQGQWLLKAVKAEVKSETAALLKTHRFGAQSE